QQRNRLSRKSAGYARSLRWDVKPGSPRSSRRSLTHARLLVASRCRGGVLREVRKRTAERAQLQGGVSWILVQHNRDLHGRSLHVDRVRYAPKDGLLVSCNVTRE